MIILEFIVVIVYCLALLMIFAFSLGQLHLTWHYLKSKKRRKYTSPDDNDKLPAVTVQLPVYNEFYVIERLIKSVAELDYPNDLLEIQVLDDSTDETTQKIIKVLEELGDEVDIKHMRRNDRSGFKAGALQFGLNSSKGELIAIFDADFIPRRDFLKSVIHEFHEPEVGLVQTRWGHLNQDYSFLTKLQAFGLNAHFSIEQVGRSEAGSFINFNGTAGVWRKKCILESGGWSSDTLTEDLDLSYRAQIKGWKFRYLEDVVSPAELPVLMSAIKSQQYRWNKGAAETAKKNLGRVVRSKLRNVNKMHAIFHLLNSTVFIFLLIAAILSIPMLFIKQSNPELETLFNLGIIFLIGFLSIGIFYWVSSRQFHPVNFSRYYLLLFPSFITVTMGLSLHNSIAVLEGLLGFKTPFIRTPKFNITSLGDSWKNNKYIRRGLNFSTVIEGLLAIYFLGGIFAGVFLKDLGLLAFHLMLSLGYAIVFIYSIKSEITHA